MFWLAVPAALYIGYKLLTREEENSYNNWRSKREEVEKTLDEHKEHIKKHIEDAQSSYDFHFLVEMHYSSMKVADAAYKTLKEAKPATDAIFRTLKETKLMKKNLENELVIAKQNKDKKNIKRIYDELKNINEFRKGLFVEKDTLVNQQNNFLTKVRELNHQTRELKLYIRDRCGSRGESWYQARLSNKK